MLAANQPVMVDDTNIINVWRDNLEQAFKEIAEIVQTVSAVECRSLPPLSHESFAAPRGQARRARYLGYLELTIKASRLYRLL